MKPFWTPVLFLFFSQTLFSQQTLDLQWVNTFNGSGDFSDRFTCIALDPAGNVVAAGSTVGAGRNRDWLIEKFTPQGTKIWSVSYNGAGNGADEVRAIATDGAGNIFATGFQKGAGSGNDILTYKFGPNGDSLWAAVFNSNSFQYDQGNSIALDAQGNVIVAGQTDTDPTSVTNDDYVTIKYSPSGQQLWAQQFNGVGNAVDRPVRVRCDASSNIYVTGTSDYGNDNDYATLKYSPTGQLLWQVLGFRAGTDRATDMVLDASGAVYVTGRSMNPLNYDYYTIKYNPANGAETWTHVFDNVDDDRPAALAVDNTGNVYVTGQSDNNPTALLDYDIRTIKISPVGATLWSNAVYAGPAGKSDVPSALLLDAQGNPVICGYSDASAAGAQTAVNNILALKYNTAGQQTFSAVFNGAASKDDVAYGLALNNNGLPLIAGFSEDAVGRNAVVLQYSAAGQLNWSSTFNGEGDNTENVRDWVKDGSGNFYLAGYSVSFNNDRDFFVAKMNALGDTIWTRKFNGTSPGSSDEATLIRLDNAGNIVVAGYLVNSGSSSDMAAMKFDPNGLLLWTYLYNGAANESDRPEALYVDPTANVYLTGRADIDPTNNTDRNALTIKLDPNGAPVWPAPTEYAGPLNSDDRGLHIGAAPNGEIRVAGNSFDGSRNIPFLLRYDAATGQILGSQTYGVAGQDIDPRAFAEDASGNWYWTGRTASVGGPGDMWLQKTDAAGAVVWARQFNGPANLDEESALLLVAPNGLVCIAGPTSTVANGLDALVVAYDTNGNLRWDTSFHQAFGNLDDIPDALTSDGSGNLYFAMHSNLGTALDVDYDVFLNCLDVSGQLLAQAQYGAAADSSDVPNLLMASGTSVWMAGSIWGTATQRDIALWSYQLTTQTGLNTISGTPRTKWYPVPFADAVTLDARDLSDARNVVWYDATGRLVAAFPLVSNSSNTFQLAHWPAGLFTYLILDGQGKTLSSGIIEKR